VRAATYEQKNTEAMKPKVGGAIQFGHSEQHERQWDLFSEVGLTADAAFQFLAATGSEADDHTATR
jgi:hypothetical protein